MSGGVPDIICVAQITLKFVDHALIVDNRGLLLFKGENLANPPGLKNGFNLDTNVGAHFLTEFADHILVSYDVTALFTNVPAHETMTILVEKAFSDNWFNETCDLNLTKGQLRELLELATTNQLFQLNGTVYE